MVGKRFKWTSLGCVKGSRKKNNKPAKVGRSPRILA